MKVSNQTLIEAAVKGKQDLQQRSEYQQCGIE